MTSSNASRLAWRDGDIITVAVTTAIGLFVLIGAWFGASGSGSVSQQMGWLNLGVAGVTVFAAGNALWLLRGRRAVGERRASLVWLDTDEDEQAAPSRAVATESSHLVCIPGAARVHRADCPLVADKHVEPADMAGCRPCGVCTP
ncbi:hypothetical protein [Haloechinothrix salitolerans]|uniref:Uncharacterized protein n=1 Tax=Haloechinothrix salitolerans TaxID=926830 RepID=A0ABW2C1I5_9PSEU